MRDLVARRRDVQRQIDDDPWTVTVYRRGLTPDNAETTWTFTGRVTPFGIRGTTIERAAAVLGGEAPVGRYAFVLLAPYNQPAMQARDEVVAVQGDITRNLHVVFATQYSYKHEAILDERE